MRPARLARSAAPVALAFLLCAAGPAAGRPVLRSIAIDGDLTDWTEVLASPENSARDADGSSVACVDSDDRDCPVSARNVDLLRFAWTSDDTYWFYYVERAASSSSQQHLYISFDSDYDGLLESGEPILHVVFRGDTSNVDTDLLAYVPVDPAGDPLTDGAGFADGWTMPGGVQIISSGNIAPGAGNIPGGARYEGAIRWQRLRVPSGVPLKYHVALARGQTLPLEIEDNMGSSSGAGDTGFRAVAIDGPFNAAGSPGTTVTVTHRMTASGNLPSRLLMKATSSSGLDVTWRRDRDGDGVAETLLAVDALGDSSFGGAGDVVTPDGDPDGDGVLDTDVLGAGTDALVELSVPLAANSRGLKETLTVETWAAEDVSLRASSADVIRSGDVTIARDELRQAAAGETAWVSHVVVESSGRSRVAGFSAFSARGWLWNWWLDPNSDGDPADAIPLTDTDRDGRPDLTLAPMQQVRVFASAAVPSTALTGLVESATIRLHENMQVASTVSDTVVVSPMLDLAPSWLLADGSARYAGAGDAVYFPHRLTNGSGRLTDFRLVASCDRGWPVQVMVDPDGDGRPGDAVPLTGAQVRVPVSGGTLPLIVRVSVPPTGRVDDVGTVTVTAVAVADARVTATVTDQAVVALVRVYDDPATIYNVSTVPECSTVHAVATGLAPATTYRLTWRDPSGSSLRLQQVATDAAGRCSGSLLLSQGLRGGGFSADIEGLTGGSWVVLDAAPFAVGDEIEATLEVGPPLVDVAAGHLDANATLFNASFDQPITAADLTWRIRSPDGLTILDEAGAFVPFTGTEATSRATLTLPPRAYAAMPFSISGVQFPALGTWTVALLRRGTCGVDAVVATAPFTVTDDADLDGLDSSGEAALGTDPFDADTDDDGLADGLEGAGDSDRDGVNDAHECDADDDGLPDGLEAGVAGAAGDTNLAAGCFRADQDPATTTDPHAADTDGGGVPDGVEDPGADGRVDPGDADPVRPADDPLLDRDADGLSWLREQGAGTSDADADSDDDGLEDGRDGTGDTDLDDVPDLLDCDSDDDGLFDGLETGAVTPGPDTDLAAGCFVADTDPTQQTEPDVADTDGGGLADGAEDLDGDGGVDPGETSPNDVYDDFGGCSRLPPPAVTGVTVAKDGAGGARVAWDAPLPADPCVTFVIESSESLPGLTDAATGVIGATWTDVRPGTGAAVRFYGVRAESSLTGRGP